MKPTEKPDTRNGNNGVTSNKVTSNQVLSIALSVILLFVTIVSTVTALNFKSVNRNYSSKFQEYDTYIDRTRKVDATQNETVSGIIIDIGYMKANQVEMKADIKEILREIQSR